MKTEPLSLARPLSSTSPALQSNDSAPPLLKIRRILVPLDFSELSVTALRYAIPFAQQFGAQLTLLHVVPPPVYNADIAFPLPPVEDLLAAPKELVRAIRRDHIPDDVSADLAVRHDFVHEAILKVASETRADLIIISTHGHTGFKRLVMGSTAENIVRHAPCPVLVMRELEHDFV